MGMMTERSPSQVQNLLRPPPAMKRSSTCPAQPMRSWREEDGKKASWEPQIEETPAMTRQKTKAMAGKMREQGLPTRQSLASGSFATYVRKASRLARSGLTAPCAKITLSVQSVSVQAGILIR